MESKVKLIIFFADVMPPELECPENFTVTMSEDDDFVIVTLFPHPNITGTFSLI